MQDNLLEGGGGMRVRGVEGRGDLWRSGVCQPLILPIRLTNERGQCSWAAGCWLQVQVGGGGACGGGQHLPGGGLLRLRLQLLQHHQLPRGLRPHLRPPRQLRVHERTHLLHHSHRRRPGSLLQQPPHGTSLPQEGLRNHGLALHRHPRPSPGQERVGPGGGAAGAGRSGWGLFRYCLHLCEGIRAAGAEREVRALFATVLRAGDGLQLPANFPTCPHRTGGNLLAVGVRLPAKLHRAASVPFRAPLPLRNPKVPHPVRLHLGGPRANNQIYQGRVRGGTHGGTQAVHRRHAPPRGAVRDDGDGRRAGQGEESES